MGAKGSAIRPAEPDIPLSEVVVSRDPVICNETVDTPNTENELPNTKPDPQIPLPGLVQVEVESVSDCIKFPLLTNIANESGPSCSKALLSSKNAIKSALQSASECTIINIQSIHKTVEPVETISHENVPSSSKELEQHSELNNETIQSVAEFPGKSEATQLLVGNIPVVQPSSTNSTCTSSLTENTTNHDLNNKNVPFALKLLDDNKPSAQETSQPPPPVAKKSKTKTFPWWRKDKIKNDRCKEDKTINESGPSTSKNVGPSTSKNVGPSTSKNVGPSTSKNFGPSTSKNVGPSTSKNVGPSTSKNFGPSTSKNVGPSTSKNFGPSTSKNVGPSTSKNVGPSTSKNVGPSTSKNFGPSTSKNVGPSTSKNVGPSTSKNFGPSTSKNVGPSTSKNVGPSTSKNVGPSTSKNVGPSTSKNVGPSTSKNVDPSTSKNFGPSTSKNVGPSKSKNVASSKGKNALPSSSQNATQSTSKNVDPSSSKNATRATKFQENKKTPQNSQSEAVASSSNATEPPQIAANKATTIHKDVENVVIDAPIEGSLNNGESDPAEVQISQSLFKRIWNYQPKRDSLWVKAVLRSNLPGLRECAQPDIHITMRLFWFCFFWLCVSLLAVFVTMTIIKLKSSPVLVVYESKEISTSRLPFPTIALNMLYSFKRTVLDGLFDVKFIDDENEMNNVTSTDENGVKYEPWSNEQSTGLTYVVSEACTPKFSLSSLYNQSSKDTAGNLQEYKEYILANLVVLLDDPDSRVFKDNKIVKFLQQGMLDCSQFVAFCAWNGIADKCKEMFSFSYNELGGTCSFNRIAQAALRRYKTVSTMMETTIDDKTLKKFLQYNLDRHLVFKDNDGNDTNDEELFPLRQKTAGKAYGFSALLKYDEKIWSCKQQDGVGILMGLHSIFDEADVQNFGIGILPNHEVIVHIFPEIMIADESIISIDRNIRGCVFTHEIKLKYFNHYTQNNCVRECISDEVLRVCNCSLLSSPKFPGTRLCDPLQRQCAERVQRELYGTNSEKVCKKCLPNCNNIKYRVTVYAVPYSKKNPPLLAEDLLRKNITTTILHVTYGVTSVMATFRRPEYEFYEILIIVGGIFGTWIGVSIMDIAWWTQMLCELISFLSCKICMIPSHLQRVFRKSTNPNTDSGTIEPSGINENEARTTNLIDDAFGDINRFRDNV